MTAASILFRADASLDIGTGHIMRCLTLAEALRKQGANCGFVCRAHPGNLIDMIRQRGFNVYVLRLCPDWDGTGSVSTPHAAWLGTDWQTDAEQMKAYANEMAIDWLIVDHYALDARWESALHPHCGKLMVIDDLADRAHHCDLILDQNLCRGARDYASLSQLGGTMLVGPQYALLRPEFAALRTYSMARRSEHRLKHLLITMGGVDKENYTGKVLDALCACPLPADCHISVVMGPHAPWLSHVRDKSAAMRWPTEVLVNVSDMARLMADSDLAIGAAGSTSWERCCLGLPSLMLVLANNQYDVAQALQGAEAAELIGGAAGLGDHLPSLVMTFSEADALQRMSAAAAAVCDGLGVPRVVQHLMRYWPQ